MNVLGTQTNSVFLKEVQSHKLHQEFIVAVGATVKVGQAVKLDNAGDIVPAATGEVRRNIIGFSIHNATAGETATIGMKAFGLIWARANADSQNAGPVAFKGQSAVVGDEDYGKYGAIDGTGTDLAGWALDAGDEDEQIRIAIY